MLATPAHINRAIAAAAATFGTTINAILSASRRRDVARARLALYYVFRHDLDMTLDATAEALMRKDHTTIRYGVLEATRRLNEDAEYRAAVETVRKAALGAAITPTDVAVWLAQWRRMRAALRWYGGDNDDLDEVLDRLGPDMDALAEIAARIQAAVEVQS